MNIKLPRQKKYQEILMGLWHDAPVERAVSNAKFEIVQSLEDGKSLYVLDVFQRINQNIKSAGMGSFGMVFENGKTFKDCEKRSIKKSEYDIAKIGKRKQYIDFWPFGYKGVKAMALMQNKKYGDKNANNCRA
jgi:hypothetical protein